MTLVYFGCVHFNVGYVTIPLQIYISLYTAQLAVRSRSNVCEALAIYISSQANCIIWISAACVAQKGLSVLPWGTSGEHAPLNIFLLPYSAGEAEARLGIGIMIQLATSDPVVNALVPVQTSLISMLLLWLSLLL